MERFRDIGLKLTPQRIAILEFLEGNTSHPSAEEIFEAVRERFPTMSFATVYNTLSALRERGSLLDLTIDPEKRRFDPNTDPHNHLICLSCRKVVDITVDYRLEVPDDMKKGFRVLSNHIEFYGLCPECREEMPRDGRPRQWPRGMAGRSKSK